MADTKIDKVELSDGSYGRYTKSVAATLLSSGWTGTQAPYSYDLKTLVPDLADESSVVVGYNADSYSDDSFTAAGSSNILGGASTTIKAYGDKPTVDIPVIIQYS